MVLHSLLRLVQGHRASHHVSAMRIHVRRISARVPNGDLGVRAAREHSSTKSDLDG